MTTTTDNRTIDEIDRRILAILASGPRTPYAEIADELAEQGYEMSSEAIRRRVASLLEITTNFFLLRPDTHEWEIVLMTVNTVNEPGAKAAAFEAMETQNFWFVGGGFGTIDLYGVATLNSTEEIDELVNTVRSFDSVAEAEYFIETERTADVEKYLYVTGE